MYYNPLSHHLKTLILAFIQDNLSFKAWHNSSNQIIVLVSKPSHGAQASLFKFTPGTFLRPYTGLGSRPWLQLWILTLITILFLFAQRFKSPKSQALTQKQVRVFHWSAYFYLQLIQTGLVLTLELEENSPEHLWQHQFCLCASSSPARLFHSPLTLAPNLPLLSSVFEVMFPLILTFAMRKNDVIYAVWSQTFEALYLTLASISYCFTLHVHFFKWIPCI